MDCLVSDSTGKQENQENQENQKKQEKQEYQKKQENFEKPPEPVLKMGRCLILSGGAFSPLPAGTFSFCIACDRGYGYAVRCGITPDLVVGDFDSGPPPDTGIPVLRLPTRKDDTDTMAAVRKALELGFRDITIGCALGGRLDHAFANVQTAAYIAAHGGLARLCGEDTEIWAFRDRSLRFPRRDGWSLSVFSLSDVCEGVRIRGTKYEAEAVRLTNTFPLGVSNVWTEPEAEVSVEKGMLMVMQSRLRRGEHI